MPLFVERAVTLINIVILHPFSNLYSRQSNRIATDRIRCVILLATLIPYFIHNSLPRLYEYDYASLAQGTRSHRIQSYLGHV